MSKTKYRLGTRKSELATTQSTHVLQALEKVGVECELVLIESQGDLNRKEALYAIENTTPGLFTKQLEMALLSREIDLAVHSLKDLPTVQPPELFVAAITRRVNSEDCLLIHPSSFVEGVALNLKKGAIVGSSSLRREAQLLELRKDLKVTPLRGNVPTRVQSVREHKVDATLLAAAGIERLALSLSGVRCVPLPEAKFPAAPGQGALAIEVLRDASIELREGLRLIHHPQSEIETRVERSVLKALFGGCTLPLGVRCRYDSKLFNLNAFIGVLKDRKSTQKEWLSFHHFDISELDEETLVAKTVAHLKGFLDGTSA